MNEQIEALKKEISHHRIEKQYFITKVGQQGKQMSELHEQCDQAELQVRQMDQKVKKMQETLKSKGSYVENDMPEVNYADFYDLDVEDRKINGPNTGGLITQMFNNLSLTMKASLDEIDEKRVEQN